MNRPNRSLHLVGSLAAALAGAAAVTGLSSAAQAQIVFDTAPWTSGANNPSSTATAISTFDALAATTTAGYGCLNVTSLNGLNDQSVSGGGGSNIALPRVGGVRRRQPTQVGTWQFRWGADFGRAAPCWSTASSCSPAGRTCGGAAASATPPSTWRAWRT